MIQNSIEYFSITTWEFVIIFICNVRIKSRYDVCKISRPKDDPLLHNESFKKSCQ